MLKSRFVFTTITILLASGCQMSTEALVKQGKPIQKYYPVKQGVTVDRLKNDWLNCEIEAAQRVPQNIAVGTTPTYTTPIQTQCYSTGYGGVRCTQTGGQTYGGQSYTYDANAKLRVAAQQQCLARSGYQNVQIPKCSSGANVKPISNILPALSSGTCYVSDENGNYAITEQTM